MTFQSMLEQYSITRSCCVGSARRVVINKPFGCAQASFDMCCCVAPLPTVVGIEVSFETCINSDFLICSLVELRVTNRLCLYKELMYHRFHPDPSSTIPCCSFPASMNSTHVLFQYEVLFVDGYFPVMGVNVLLLRTVVFCTDEPQCPHPRNDCALNSQTTHIFAGRSQLRTVV